MATYIELRQLFGHGDLLNKTEVACIVAAQTISEEDAGTDNHVNRLLWAKATFTSSRRAAEQMLMVLLAANKGLATSAIISATDSTLQTAVDAAVDVFANGS